MFAVPQLICMHALNNLLFDPFHVTLNESKCNCHGIKSSLKRFGFCCVRNRPTFLTVFLHASCDTPAGRPNSHQENDLITYDEHTLLVLPGPCNSRRVVPACMTALERAPMHASSQNSVCNTFLYLFISCLLESPFVQGGLHPAEFSTGVDVPVFPNSCSHIVACIVLLAQTVQARISRHGSKELIVPGVYPFQSSTSSPAW